MPRRLRDEYVRTDGSPDAGALFGELASFAADLRRLHDEPLAPPSCPVTIISGTKPARDERGDRAALVAAHRARAASLPRARWVAAAASGHMVMLSEPQLVVDEIGRLVGTG